MAERKVDFYLSASKIKNLMAYRIISEFNYKPVVFPTNLPNPKICIDGIEYSGTPNIRRALSSKMEAE